MPCPFMTCRYNLHLDHAESINGAVYYTILQCLEDGPAPVKVTMQRVRRLTGADQSLVSTIATQMGIVRVKKTNSRPAMWELPQKIPDQKRAVRLKVLREYDPDGDYPSCVLDEADGGGVSQSDVAKALCVTRQNIQQIEKSATQKLYNIDEVHLLHDGEP